MEGYTYSHNKQKKLTQLFYMDESAQKALLITKTVKSMFKDIGLFWGFNECTTIIVRGEIQTNEENVSLSDTEELQILDTDNHYKLPSK